MQLERTLQSPSESMVPPLSTSSMTCQRSMRTEHTGTRNRHTSGKGLMGMMRNPLGSAEPRQGPRGLPEMRVSDLLSAQ